MSRLRPYHHGNLRQSLIFAATDIIESDGLEALNMRAVAEHAGVSPGAPYHHFAGKDALLEAVALQGLAALEQHSRDALQNRQQPQVQLEALGVAYITYATHHPALFKLIFSRSNDPTNTPDAPVYRLLNDVIAGFSLPASQRPTAAIAAWSLVHGLATLLVEGPLQHLAQHPKQVEALAISVTKTLTFDD